MMPSKLKISGPVETGITEPVDVIIYTTYLLISAVVDCGNLTGPANGSVNHTAGTIFRQTATYSCNTDYNLVGDSIRTCQTTGNWSGSAPTCQGMEKVVQLKSD